MTTSFERTFPMVLADMEPRPGFFEALLHALRQMSSGHIGVIEMEPAHGSRSPWVVAGVAAGAAAASGAGFLLGLRRHRRDGDRRSDRHLSDRVQWRTRES